jgi:regulator of replication initiation timing
VNLTDDAWQWLAAVAEKMGMSRNDYLEALAKGNNPLRKTASPQSQPFIETAEKVKPIIDVALTGIPHHEIPMAFSAGPVKFKTLQDNTRPIVTDALKSAVDTFQMFFNIQRTIPFIEVVRLVIEGLRKEVVAVEQLTKQKDKELLELQEHRSELGLEVQNLTKQIEKYKTSCNELRQKLETKETEGVQLRLEVVDLKEKLTAVIEENKKSAFVSELSQKALPEAAIILRQLRGKRKKTPITLTDVEAILEMIEELRYNQWGN